MPVVNSKGIRWEELKKSLECLNQLFIDSNLYFNEYLFLSI